MDLFLTIICFLFAIIAYKNTNKVHNPLTLFLGTWALVFCLYTLNPYNLPSITASTYYIYIVGFVSFLFGYLLVPNNKRLYKNKTREVNNFRFRVFIIIMLIFMVIPALKSLSLLLSGVDLYDIRYVHHDDIMGNGIVSIAFVYFCEPFITFLIVYSVVNMFIGKDKIQYLCLAIISLALMTVITGGRFFILYFIASLLIALFVYRRSPVAKKITKYSVLLLGIMILLLVIISLIRGSDIVRTIYVYLSGSIPFMEGRLSENYNLPNTLGLASLYGFIRPVFVVLRAFFSTPLPLPLQVVESVFLEDDAMYMLTPEIGYNSFVSIFYCMYLDGGLVGVAIGNIVLGILSKKIYLKLREDDMYSVILFILIGIMFLLSFFKLLICNYSYALSFIYLMFCFNHKKTLSKYGGFKN